MPSKTNGKTNGKTDSITNAKTHTEAHTEAHAETHAVIIGGSLAGLLVSRVLSDHFDRVTVIERDIHPDQLWWEKRSDSQRDLAQVKRSPQSLVTSIER